VIDILKKVNKNEHNQTALHYDSKYFFQEPQGNSNDDIDDKIEKIKKPELFSSHPLNKAYFFNT